MNLIQHKDLNIGIVGLGRTGISVFKALKGNCKSIICYDDNANNRKNFVKIFGEEHVVPTENDDWKKCNKIIVSPGIPHSHNVFQVAKDFDINISSDIELFLQNNPDSSFILVTGTNGKSTTTALIGHILMENGVEYVVGGNIGIPVLDLPQGKKGYVLELSSFQLELLGAINAQISVITNITPDHLDRHGAMEEYIRIKKKILAHDNFKVLNIDNEITREIYNYIKAGEVDKVIGFSSKTALDEIVSCINHVVKDEFFDHQEYILPYLQNLVGSHNEQNIAASFAVCRAVGVSAENIIRSIVSFLGLEHRMQFIRKINNISFYNDSKATNTASAEASLTALNNIFWLVGGIFKEDEFKLGEEIENIKKAYVFGKDKEIFAKYLEDKKEYIIVDTMENAIKLAYADALDYRQDCNILLAPACASYDQFTSYEDRGNKFMQLVKGL